MSHQIRNSHSFTADFIENLGLRTEKSFFLVDLYEKGDFIFNFQAISKEGILFYQGNKDSNLRLHIIAGKTSFYDDLCHWFIHIFISGKTLLVSFECFAEDYSIGFPFKTDLNKWHLIWINWIDDVFRINFDGRQISRRLKSACLIDNFFGIAGFGARLCLRISLKRKLHKIIDKLLFQFIISQRKCYFGLHQKYQN